MIELAATLEATELAQFLKRSRWVYPLVNAGHIFGLALLVGAIVPMDVATLRGRRVSHSARGWAIAGLVIAVICGSLLFMTQAGDYIANGWFQAKMAVLGLAIANALWHLRGVTRKAAFVSLVAWPGVLILGRMIGYS